MDTFKHCIWSIDKALKEIFLQHLMLDCADAKCHRRLRCYNVEYIVLSFVNSAVCLRYVWNKIYIYIYIYMRATDKAYLTYP